MSLPPYTLGILSGGRSTRAGGHDKGWLVWNEQPLIKHQLARFGEPASSVLISANRELDRYRQLPATLALDQRPGFPGPLAGLEALMYACTLWPLVVIPCDMPTLPDNLPSALLSGLNSAPVTVAHDGERQQHLCLALRDPGLIASLASYLDQGERSVHGWLNTNNVTRITFHKGPAAFANINEAPGQA